MEIIPLDFTDLDPKSLNGAIVRQHNDLIEARYQVPNLKEQQVIMMLLAKIKPDDEDFKGYRITVTDFAKTFGLNTNKVYEDMERVTRSLRCREVGIRNGKSFFYTGWLSSVEYIHGSGYVELCFDPKLKPYLLQLKNHFTQYSLDTVLHFKSIYAIRLYELLKKEAQIIERYQKKKDFEKEFTYEFLREAFGIEKKQYKLFADFKRFAIEPAVTEIYDKTEFNITDVKYGKTGRAVSKITFVVEIRSKADADIRAVQIRLEEQPKAKEKEEDHFLIKILMENGFAWEVAKKFFQDYGVKKIEIAIACMEMDRRKGTVIKNPPAYLTKAIVEGWGVPVSKEKVIEEKRKQEAEEKARKEKEDEEKASAQKALKKKTIEAFFDLPNGLKSHIKTEYRAILENKNNGNNVLFWDNTIDSQERLFASHIAWDFTNFLIEKNYVN